jgi:hypothetical protein
MQKKKDDETMNEFRPEMVDNKKIEEGLENSELNELKNPST